MPWSFVANADQNIMNLHEQDHPSTLRRSRFKIGKALYTPPRLPLACFLTCWIIFIHCYEGLVDACVCDKSAHTCVHRSKCVNTLACIKVGKGGKEVLLHVCSVFDVVWLMWALKRNEQQWKFVLYRFPYRKCKFSSFCMKCSMAKMGKGNDLNLEGIYILNFNMAIHLFNRPLHGHKSLIFSVL